MEPEKEKKKNKIKPSNIARVWRKRSPAAPRLTFDFKRLSQVVQYFFFFVSLPERLQASETAGESERERGGGAVREMEREVERDRERRPTP